MSHPPGRWERALFVDSSAFFAASERRDANFLAAHRILRQANGQQRPLVTSNYVVAEAHALFLSRLGRERGVRFLRLVEASTILIVRPTEDDEMAAKAIIYRYTDKDFSLTDAISFVVMERRRIPVAFTFDRDFERYGFSIAGP